MYTNTVFGDTNSVLFIKVSLFQGVLLRGPTCPHVNLVIESKATESNYTSFFFQEKKLAASGGTQPHDILHTVQMIYCTS